MIHKLYNPLDVLTNMAKKGFKPIPSDKLVGRMVNGVPKGTKSYIVAKTRELEQEKKKFLWEHLSEGKGKVTFSKDIAESVVGTFELIIKTAEGTNRTSLTVDELKTLQEECRRLYYNKKVILQ